MSANINIENLNKLLENNDFFVVVRKNTNGNIEYLNSSGEIVSGAQRFASPERAFYVRHMSRYKNFKVVKFKAELKRMSGLFVEKEPLDNNETEEMIRRKKELEYEKFKVEMRNQVGSKSRGIRILE